MGTLAQKPCWQSLSSYIDLKPFFPMAESILMPLFRKWGDPE
jgi:hypothetical protein